MNARTALATVFVAVALTAATAGEGTREAERADVWAVVNSLRNLSDVQKQALRNFLLATVEKETQEMLARLQQEIDDVKEADLAAAMAAVSKPGKRSLGPVLHEEDIRQFLREGLPSRGIPPLDPFTLSYAPLNISVPDIIDLQVNIEDLSFNGLSSFQEDVETNVSSNFIRVILRAYTEVLIPRLQLLTHYKAEGISDLGLDIWGDGLINLVLNNLNVDANVAIKIRLYNISHPVVSPCEIRIKSSDIELEIDGLFGDELLSQHVSEVITDEVNAVLGDELDLIASTIQGGLCGWLSSRYTHELVRLITTITSMPLPDTTT